MVDYYGRWTYEPDTPEKQRKLLEKQPNTVAE